jgi:hypothetical protein
VALRDPVGDFGERGLWRAQSIQLRGQVGYPDGFRSFPSAQSQSRGNTSHRSDHVADVVI